MSLNQLIVPSISPLILVQNSKSLRLSIALSCSGLPMGSLWDDVMRSYRKQWDTDRWLWYSFLAWQGYQMIGLFSIWFTMGRHAHHESHGTWLNWRVAENICQRFTVLQVNTFFFGNITRRKANAPHRLARSHPFPDQWIPSWFFS